MNRAFVVLLMCVALFALTSISRAEQPRQDRVYYMRKAFCEKEAAAKHFGVHWIKRHRYIRKCLAESRR
jgi:hypothetical protein